MNWLNFILGFLSGLASVAVLIIFVGGYIGYFFSLTRRKTKMQLQKPDPEAEQKINLKDRLKAQGEAYMFGLNPEEVELKSRDGLTLRGYFIPAPQPTGKMVVLSHGYRNHGPGEWSVFIQFYHEVLGWNILVPDHRAHGRSDGKRIGFAALEWQDLYDWVEAFKGRCEGEPIVALHGISMGAATVLNCNVHTPPACVKTIVEDCGFTNGYEMISLAGHRDMHLRLPLTFWGLAFWYRVLNGVSLKKASDPLGNISQYELPTLFIHGAADGFVPTEMGHRLYEAATVEKDCLFIPEAAHAMAYFIGKEAYEAKLLEWYGKYMDEKAAAAAV